MAALLIAEAAQRSVHHTTTKVSFFHVDNASNPAPGHARQMHPKGNQIAASDRRKSVAVH
jgi:hypothetical protein